MFKNLSLIIVCFILSFAAVGTAHPASVPANYTTTYTYPDCDNPDSTTGVYSSANPTALKVQLQATSSTYTKICIRPGDYRTSVGDVAIGRSCSGGSPCVITCAKASTAFVHPYDRSTADQCIFRSIRWSGKSNWIVHGITQDDTALQSSQVYPFKIELDSDNIVFDAMYIKGGRGSSIILTRGSDNFTIQDSYLTSVNASGEKACIYITPSGDNYPAATYPQYQNVSNMHAFNNEFHNCHGDGIQIQASGVNGYVPNMQVKGNDFYVSPDNYTDCNNNQDPNGRCACSENALDYKSASLSGSPIVIQDNNFWGFRYSEKGTTGYCLNGISDPGNVINGNIDAGASDNVRYINFINNRIWDSANGLVYDPAVSNSTISGNIVYDVGNTDVWANPDNGLGAWATGGQSVTFTNNVTIKSDVWWKTNSGTWDAQNNTFISAGDWRANSGHTMLSGTVFSNNTLHNTSPYDDYTYQAVGTVANNTSDSQTSGIYPTYCTNIKQISDPQEYCIPDGGAYLSSPPGGSVPGAPTPANPAIIITWADVLRYLGIN